MCAYSKYMTIIVVEELVTGSIHEFFNINFIDPFNRGAIISKSQFKWLFFAFVDKKTA